MPIAHVQHPVKVSLIAMAGSFLITMMVVLAKLAAERHAIVEITFWRNIVGAICLTALVANSAQGFAMLKTTRPVAHFGRGITGLIGLSLNFYAVTLLPLAQQTALYFAMPLMVTILAIPMLKETVDWRRWAGVLIGLVGILIMTHPTGHANLFGTVVALGGAFFTALVAIQLRSLGTSEPELRTVFWFFTLAAIISACFLPWYWTMPTGFSLACLIGSGLCGTAGQILNTRAYAMAPAGFLSPFNYISIIYSTFMGWLIWNEWPDIWVFVGAGIVITAGIVTVALERARMKKAESEAEATYG